MHRDYLLYLDDILEAIRRIRLYTENMDREAFVADQRTMDAVIRNLEIIGEASAKLPEHIREITPDIEWRKIIAMRNILAHEYFGVNADIIWDVIQNKLNVLARACEEI